MLRLRRHPAAGLILLAILTPLLAAGPGMPCSGRDAGHHREIGHVALELGHNVHTGDAAGATQEAIHGGSAAHPVATGSGTPETVQAPEPTSPPPGPVSCTMGMLCSGTVITSAPATLAAAPVVHATPATGAQWTLHTSDLSLPRRPPRA
ncbi:MAG: hypothetical protein R6X22_14100 [Gemmatimonadota bacterium]